MFGIPVTLLDKGFWRRIGIFALGAFLINVGLIIILRRPIETAAQGAAVAAA